MIKKLITIFHPERFQGWGKKKKYFEGWYYKVLNADRTKAYAFIPGIAFDEKGQGHSFVQVLDGLQSTAEYHRYPLESFKSSHSRLEVNVENNFFSDKRMRIDVPGISGELQFYNIRSWPSSVISPGIMGPFSFVPFMECNHGIVSMNHHLEGKLNINGETIDFHNGLGYIEKDWGSSFPEAYIWMQTNHFELNETSLKLSIAKIPWLGSYFIGFIGGLYYNNRLYQFTTYNGSKIKTCRIEKEHIVVELINKKHSLKVRALRSDATPLAAPILGKMQGKIEESMTSLIEVEMFDRKRKQIAFRATGSNAALEIAGKTELLET